jgi:hypothetical protein
LTTTLNVLHRLAAEPGGSDRVLQRFLRACLALFGEAAGTRPDLAGIREELQALCGLALTALDSDCDDRPLLARERGLVDLPGLLGYVARVPGRVVWLAAMAANLPEEEGAATVMLIDDLRTVDLDLPLRALQAAVRS